MPENFKPNFSEEAEMRLDILRESLKDFDELIEKTKKTLYYFKEIGDERGVLQKEKHLEDLMKIRSDIIESISGNK